jgi:hypothetical protein
MEFSPKYFWDANNQSMAVAEGLLDGSAPGSVPAWQTHGTHVLGSILARPYPPIGHPDFDPGTAAMGVAPGAYAMTYRALHGWTYTSIIISGIEWSFRDGATVVNASIGGMMSASMVVQNIFISQLMLADPNFVFVTSAGNNGNQFFTGSNPGGQQMISVAMFTEANSRGSTITSPGFTGSTNFSFVLNRDLARLQELDNGRLIVNTPGVDLAHNNGEIRIFPMPLVSATPVTAGIAHVPVGAGTVQDVAALVETFGREALQGHYVLIRRGEGTDVVSQRLVDIGMAGAISINNQLLVPPLVAAAGNNSHLVPIIMIPYEQGMQWATSMVHGGTTPVYHNVTFQGQGGMLTPGQTTTTPPEFSTSTFVLSEPGFIFGHGLPVLAGGSSRGPIEHSFEIFPHVGAQGQQVFSTFPRWHAQAGGTGTAANPLWNQGSWTRAYGSIGGTSMSSPQVAGAVALMQQHSRLNEGGQWANYEIKTRLMNTSMPLDYEGNIYSAFDGARNINVREAIDTNSVVAVRFDRLPTDLFMDYESQNFVTTLTGSFSFGGFNRAIATGNPRNIGDRAHSETMTAEIHNNSNAPVTYTITHNFIPAGHRPARPAGSNTAPLGGAALTFSQTSITVPANSMQTFTATINIPAGTDLGFYEGTVTVRGNNGDTAILPFAAVTHSRQPAFNFLGLHRPVITTNTPAQGAQNMTSNELVMSYSQTWGFYADMYLIDGAIVNNPAFTGDNWWAGEILPDGSRDLLFADYILGTVMGTTGESIDARHFNVNRGINPLHTMRGVIFDGYYAPGLRDTLDGMSEPRRLEREGNFFIGMNIFRQTITATQPGAAAGQSQNWFWDQSELIPFAVDNTPPQLTAHNIAASGNNIVVTGTVAHAWTQTATGMTNGMWTTPRPVNLQNNIGVWVLAGDNVAGNRPVRADVAANGTFNVTLTNALQGAAGDVAVTIWVIDGYAPVPIVNQVPVGSGNPALAAFWNQPALARIHNAIPEHFTGPSGLVRASAADEAQLRADVLFGRAHNLNPQVFGINEAMFGQYAWGGLNVATYNFSVAAGAPATDGIFELPPLAELANVYPPYDGNDDPYADLNDDEEDKDMPEIDNVDDSDHNTARAAAPVSFAGLNFNVPQFHADVMAGNAFAMMPTHESFIVTEMTEAAVANITVAIRQGTEIGTALPTAVHPNGYRFVGFNTEQDGSGTAITAATVVTGPITAYAIWDTNVVSGLITISPEHQVVGVQRTRTVTVNEGMLPAGTNLNTLTLWAVIEAGASVLVVPQPVTAEFELMYGASATRLLVVLTDGLHHAFTGDLAHNARLFGMDQLTGLTP